MRRLKNLVRRILITRWLLLQARALLVFRRFEPASHILQRVVTFSPASFGAHFLLGRVGLALDARVEAIQEFAICNRLDPERFSRARISQSVRAEVAMRYRSAQESSLFEMIAGEVEPIPGEWDDLIEAQESSAADETHRELDSLDSAERRRCRDLPPIQRADLDQVDLDELLMRLLEDPHPGNAKDA